MEILDFTKNKNIYYCDFCGKHTQVKTTKHGTTHYNRLICKECAEKINAEQSQQFNYKIFKIIK